MKRLLALAVLSLCLAACGGEDGSPSEGTSSSVSKSAAEEKKQDEAPTASEVAESIKGEVSDVSKVVTITEDNDPNDMIGRPNGYVDGAILFDTRAEPLDEELGVDQGATIEVWPSEREAKDRSEYIQGLLDESDGMLGSEYHFRTGAMLLRVSGSIKPSDAKAYEAAFASAT